MNKKELIHAMLMQYFIIYTGTMFASLIWCGVLNPAIQFSQVFLWKIALFSLCADLPCAVYYSEEELSRKQFWIRTAIHTCLLEAVLLFAGYQIEMYRGFWGGVIFAGAVIAVDLFVHFISFLSSVHAADKINKRLKQSREEVRK